MRAYCRGELHHAELPRPRKPRALKILQGTDQPVRRRPEPKFAVASIAEPPDWLIDPVALEAWHRIGTQLVEQKVLRSPHLDLFAHFCNMHARSVKKWRLGSEPTAAEQAQLRMWGNSFTLTPEAMSRAGAPGGSEDENPFRKLEQREQKA